MFKYGVFDKIVYFLSELIILELFHIGKNFMSEENNFRFKRMLKSIIEYPHSWQAVASILSSIITLGMVILTYFMVSATNKMVDVSKKNVQYALNEKGYLSLDLTLRIKVDRTKITPRRIQRMSFFIGSEYKINYKDFDFEIVLNNNSPISLDKEFELFILLKSFDQEEQIWSYIGDRYRISTISGLKPKEGKIITNIRQQILDSGILSARISDTANVLITLEAVFKDSDKDFIPKLNPITEIDYY